MSNRWSIVLYWVERKALIGVRPEKVLLTLILLFKGLIKPVHPHHF